MILTIIGIAIFIIFLYGLNEKVNSIADSQRKIAAAADTMFKNADKSISDLEDRISVVEEKLHL